MTQRRILFPMLIESAGIKTAVEVGTLGGEFAKTWLSADCLKKVYLIDCWINPQQTNFRAMAYELARTDNRVEVIEKPSLEAVKQFDSLSVDFVYIDAMHDYDNAKADINAWWPKTKKIIAGHDYVPYNTAGHDHCGVIPAVEEFAASKERDVMLDGKSKSLPERLLTAYRAGFTKDAEQFPSWMIVK